MTLPLFDRLAPSYKKFYDGFFDATDPAKDLRMDLEDITFLAEEVEHALSHANPIWDTQSRQWGDQSRSQEARQWHLDSLSRVKRRLSQAIIYKKEYYENTWMGKITRFILKLFCAWNNGTTKAIRKAENFLLRYDSRYPVHQISGGRYESNTFWPYIPHTSLTPYNMAHFFNYDPPRAIEVQGGNNSEMPRFMVAVT